MQTGLEGRFGPDGFKEFQHPKLVAKPPSGADWLHEVKFDGYRMQVHVKKGRATFYTRNGLDWSKRFPYLGALAGELDDCVFDAELCALGPDGYSSFSALRSAIHKDPDSLVLVVFDVLFQGWDDLRDYPLQSRKNILRKLLDDAGDPISCGIRYAEPLPGQGAQLLEAACKLKWEGIVSKRRDAPYRHGRTETWVKAKCRPSESIVIGGYVTSNGRFSYLLGGVREPDGSLRYAGSIKGGYSAEVALGLLPKIRALATDEAPFKDPPRKTSDIHWLRPELLAEVEMAEFTASGKMRQASFKGLREDL